MRLSVRLHAAPFGLAPLLGLAILTFCGIAPPAVASGPQATPERIAELVRELGSEKFAAREKATRELIALGIVTHEALTRAAGDPDAEIRVRARAVLDAVSESDFLQRLEAFSADYDGSHHRTLPAWDQFSAQFGASRLARELFVEMQRAEPEVLDAMAKGPKSAAAALAERSRVILESQNETQLSLGTLSTFLFVGASDGVTVDEQGAAQMFPYIVQLTYQRNSKSPYWPVVLKKLVGHWIAKDTTPAMAVQNMNLAAHLELRPEALIVASRILSNEAKQPVWRLSAILVVARFGDKAQVAVLEKILDDTSPCPSRPESLPAEVQLQTRDVALAVLVQLTDQDIHRYGEVAGQPIGGMGFQAAAFSFPNDEARQTALKKWSAWRAEHPDS